MSELTLTKIRLSQGTYLGHITGAATSGARPDIRVTYLDQPIEAELADNDTPGTWSLSFAIPPHALTDGVHSFLIFDSEADLKLGDLTLIAGAPAADDLRAEVELLRAELDMLKRAFRRHCLETM
ncbi:MAG: hypothetical protein AB8B51_00025 [Sedimentitalea sp.]